MAASLERIQKLLARKSYTVPELADKLKCKPSDVHNALRNKKQVEAARIFKEIDRENSNITHYYTYNVVDEHAATVYRLLGLLHKTLEHFYPGLPQSETNIKALRKACQDVLSATQDYVDQPVQPGPDNLFPLATSPLEIDQPEEESEEIDDDPDGPQWEPIN